MQNDYLSYKYTIPTWAITALVYEDYSSLDMDDAEDIDNFISQLEHDFNGRYTSFEFPDDIGGAQYFTNNHDFSRKLGCDCVDVQITAFNYRG